MKGYMYHSNSNNCSNPALQSLTPTRNSRHINEPFDRNELEKLSVDELLSHCIQCRPSFKWNEANKWCRYCGARGSRSFASSPWGPKKLCSIHHKQWTQNQLNLSIFVEPDTIESAIQKSECTEKQYLIHVLLQHNNTHHQHNHKHSDDSECSDLSDIESSSDSFHSSYCTSSDSDSDQQALTKEEQSTEAYKCKDCGDVLSSHTAFKAHCVKIHKNKRPFSCKHCGKTYINYRSFESHVMGHNIAPKQSSRRFACPKCHRVFRYKYYMKRHFINIHIPNADKPYQCRYCLYGAATKKQIVRHENVHRNERAYKCALCCRAFNNKKNLKDHTANHHIRPFSCNHCGKAFGTKRYLDLHILSVHNKYKNHPFQCSYGGCSYGALTAKGMKRHNVKHQSEKPFKCGLCGRRFKLLSYLHGHMDRIHVEQKEMKPAPLPLPTKPKDDECPKKPLTAFFVFNTEARIAINKEFPGKGVVFVARELGRRWNALNQKEKKPYHKEAVRRREQYTMDINKYRKSNKYKEYQKKVNKWKRECAAIRNQAKESEETEESDTDMNTDSNSEYFTQDSESGSN